MRVVVAATSPACFAHRALVNEGVEHEERVCLGDYAYGALLAEMWRLGGFVLLERDIVPWPGAVQSLIDCNSDYCNYRFPAGGASSRGLGCVKFSDRLTTAYPDLAIDWPEIPWWELADYVLRAVYQADGKKAHYHEPMVAHLKWPAPS